jgi:hypothetical protein
MIFLVLVMMSCENSELCKILCRNVCGEVLMKLYCTSRAFRTAVLFLIKHEYYDIRKIRRIPDSIIFACPEIFHPQNVKILTVLGTDEKLCGAFGIVRSKHRSFQTERMFYVILESKYWLSWAHQLLSYNLPENFQFFCYNLSEEFSLAFLDKIENKKPHSAPHLINNLSAFSPQNYYTLHNRLKTYKN